MSEAAIVVVGIGADGWPGLGEPARAAILAADTVIGSARQLELLPPTSAALRPWPSPIDPLVDEIVTGAAGAVCVLASGDPMLHGIGATLARRVDPARLEIHQHPSAFALACARLRWPEAEVELVSAVGRPAAAVSLAMQPGRRMIAYVAGPQGATEVARIARDHGFGASRMVVLEQLGGDDERIVETSPLEWGERRADRLHAVALELHADRGAAVLARTPGLPDDAYVSDGQLTKRPVRAVTLAALAPLPGALLWDVGAGSGSISIEWLRAEPTARAIALEARRDRVENAAENARRLGVPTLDVRHGRAPEALVDLEPPDAVFIGGGVTDTAVLERCWDSLRPGGRLVANAVTLEGEQALHSAREAYGGELLRIATSRPEPVGRFESWRAQLPVVQWSVAR